MSVQKNRIYPQLVNSVSNSPPACFAVDVNPNAADVSRRTAVANDVYSFEAVNGDLLTPFTERYVSTLRGSRIAVYNCIVVRR